MSGRNKPTFEANGEPQSWPTTAKLVSPKVLAIPTTSPARRSIEYSLISAGASVPP
jgi:hypothetical protein